MSATIKLEKNHFPVLLDELVSIISPLYSGTHLLTVRLEMVAIRKKF